MSALAALPAEDKARVLMALTNHRTDCLKLAGYFLTKYGQCRAVDLMREEADATTRLLATLA